MNDNNTTVMRINFWRFKPLLFSGDARVVQILIEHGAEVDIQYKNTHYLRSPLHYAALKGNFFDSNSKTWIYWLRLRVVYIRVDSGHLEKVSQSNLDYYTSWKKNWIPMQKIHQLKLLNVIFLCHFYETTEFFF